MSFQKKHPHVKLTWTVFHNSLPLYRQWDSIPPSRFSTIAAAISLSFSPVELRNETASEEYWPRLLVILSPWKQRQGVLQRLDTLPCRKGLEKSDWNFIFGVANFWLVRFLQPVIISNVSVGLHRYLKTLTRVLYNFPILPAPSVLNCIGRWIFGIWGCQVSAMEDFMH